MDLELSRIDAIQDWTAAIERAAAATADGSIGPVVAALGDTTSGAAVVRHLIDSSKLQELAGALEASPAGQALSVLLATPAYGRQLLGTLVSGQSAADLAAILAGDHTGESPLGTMVGTDTRVARNWSRSLVSSVPVRTRAKDLLDGPAARTRAQALLDGAAGRRLAGWLGGDDSGRVLVRHLANTPAAGSMALALIARQADAASTQALATSPAALHLASAVAATTDGQRLVGDLLATQAGTTIRLGLTDTPQGRELLANLAADDAGAEVRTTLADADAGDRLFGDEIDGVSAVLRIVVLIALLLVLLIEPLALAGLALLVAGVTAADLPSLPPLDGIPTHDEHQLRLTIDVGPRARAGEVAQILADLDLLAGLARSTDLEVPVDVVDLPDREEGSVLTAPPLTSVGGGELRVVELHLRNPMELVVATAADPAALARTIRLPIDLRRATLEMADLRHEFDQLGGGGVVLGAIERLSAYDIDVDDPSDDATTNR